MTEIVDAPRRRRSVLDRLIIGLLIGVAAISVGAIALLAVYLNRISDAASALHRVDSLGAYEGRPTPVSVDGVNALNFLLTTTTADGDLDAVLIAHLSASRARLTLVAVPVDLQATAGTGTLAAAHASDPLLVVRDLERLTGARMDHQVHIDRDRFALVVDSLDGIELNGAGLDGTQAVVGLASVPVADRSMASAELLRATLVRADSGSAITEPTRFDRMLNALTPCLKVDASLTEDAIKALLVESKVHADEIAVTPLVVVRSASAARPDDAALAGLRDAFARDDFGYADVSLSIASEPSPEPTK